MITCSAIGFVRSPRTEVLDDDWGEVVSRIELVGEIPDEALSEIDAFSHVEIVYHFDRVALDRIEFGARHPRNNLSWPKVGIFAQRGKNRPNRIGVCTARILSREPRAIVVRGLDAVDGTPVLDIKPVMQEFLPREVVSQPEWSKELMRGYWRKAGP